MTTRTDPITALVDRLRALTADRECPTCHGYGPMGSMELVGVPGNEGMPMYGCDACTTLPGDPMAATGCIPGDARAKAALLALAKPTRPRYQSCGCVICICPDNDADRCMGCGATHCGKHPMGALPDWDYVVRDGLEPVLDAAEAMGFTQMFVKIGDDYGNPYAVRMKVYGRWGEAGDTTRRNASAAALLAALPDA